MNQIEQELFTLMSSKDYKITIRNAGKFRFPANYKFLTHTHPEIEINYINSGCCIMGVGNEMVPLKKGDCIVIQPYQKHLFMVDMSNSCSISQLEYCVSLPAGILEHILCLTCDKEFYVISSCESIYEVIDSVCRYHRSDLEDEYAQAQLNLAMLQLYVLLSKHIRLLPGQRIINADKIGAIARVIQKRLDSDINIEELAEEFGVSSRYIRKIFAEQAGMSCTHYITMLRIAKAKQLLWDSALPVTEIGLMCGFNSTQYFSRIFKKYTAMTPGEYRNLWRGTRAVINGEQAAGPFLEQKGFGKGETG